MISKINQDEIQVVWWYETELVTHCTIRNKGKTLVSEQVRRYYKEANDRNSARKYSLEKCMETLNLTKAERTVIWKDYMSQINYLNRNKIEVHVHGGVAFCYDNRVVIIDHDDLQDEEPL